jgi:hypothetical protein
MKLLVAPAIVGGLCAIGGTLFALNNPLLFGRRTGVPYDEFEIFKSHPILDSELAKVRTQILPEHDFEAYRNHCLRVLTFAKWHLPDSVFKQFPNAMDIIAMALAYHDVALWTDGELSYLDPSVKQMEHHVRRQRSDDEEETSNDAVFEKEDIEIAKDIIQEHHKLTAYYSSSNKVDEETVAAANNIVNAVRKADWADASYGVVRFGLPTALMEGAYEELPEGGFHNMLANFGKRLSPDSKIGTLAVLNIFKL